ncbi:DUF433 domain-containing protein [Alienimonas sp. DA493]|uniref:DUF433 domain-containing protein n=1 Tax=Alienimonas sp. DA493 TaxID=3373605 RepID=UPI003754D431
MSAATATPASPAKETEELLQRISVDPNVCFGKPCVRGTRMMVWVVLDLLGAGETIEQIVEDYPYLSREDVRACLLYASTLPALRTGDPAALDAFGEAVAAAKARRAAA